MKRTQDGAVGTMVMEMTCNAGAVDPSDRIEFAQIKALCFPAFPVNYMHNLA